MRVIRFLDEDGAVRYGADLDAERGTAQLLEGDPWSELRPAERRVPVERLLAPVPTPPAVMGIGLNYRQHAAETGADLPQRPVLFMKNPAAVIGPEAPIVIPPVASDPPEVDYEVEMAVVIGRAARDVPMHEALGYVAGYTIGNDVSARRWQKKAGGGQWVRGKSFDTFCPLGPALVTPDELADPQRLALTCRVNGETRQEATTADMVFPVAELIAYLSSGTTLLPGTVILTGTPAGVGVGRTPPAFLAPGDRVELTIDRIGTLANPVEAG